MHYQTKKLVGKDLLENVFSNAIEQYSKELNGKNIV